MGHQGIAINDMCEENKIECLHSILRIAAKKPPTTMDDLFRRASKYSMLEDDVRATTQQILVAGQTSRSGVERSAKSPDWPRPSG